MPLRVVDVWLPTTALNLARQLAENVEAVSFTPIGLGDERWLCRVTLEQPHVEALLNTYESHFDEVEGFRALVFSVEASIPSTKDSPSPEPASGAKPVKGKLGISVQELYEDIDEGAETHTDYVAQTVLATVVAAIGLTRDLPAVVIGAMVIAPLLGPHMALGLATTLVDWRLARKALISAAVGLALTVATAIVLAFILEFDGSVGEVASRTRVVISDVPLALASGVAGALAYRRGLAGSLVGVMVAVALMPPAVVASLMVAQANWMAAAGAALLLTLNVVCINLAAVVTFAFLGVRPRSWHKEDHAAIMRWAAVGIWLLMLAGALVILVWQEAHRELVQ